MSCLSSAPQGFDGFTALVRACVDSVYGPGWEVNLDYGLWTVAIVAVSVSATLLAIVFTSNTRR